MMYPLVYDLRLWHISSSYQGGGIIVKYLNNTGLHPMNNHKATTCQHPMLGPHWHASEMAFCLQANDGPLLVVFEPSLPSSTKTKNVRVGAVILWKNIKESANESNSYEYLQFGLMSIWAFQ